MNGGQVNLENSYSQAVSIMKDKAVSFYHAFSHLPRERFLAVAAVYAFCRSADDIADSDSLEKDNTEKRKRLKLLEEEVLNLYSKEKKNSSFKEDWWEALKDTISKFKIPVDSFLDQIKGQLLDLDFKDIKNSDELINYCRLVAGSVGHMLLPILVLNPSDANNPKLLRACINLGIGMQITNILRDVGEDIRNRNRVYIPSDLLSSYGVNRKELETLASKKNSEFKNNLISREFINLWEELAQTAEGYYSEYLRYIHLFHPDCRLPIVGAALNYNAIADAVRNNKYNCFTVRSYTSKRKRNNLMKKAKDIVGKSDK